MNAEKNVVEKKFIVARLPHGGMLLWWDCGTTRKTVEQDIITACAGSKPNGIINIRHETLKVCDGSIITD